MPAGELLLEKVASLLSVQIGKTADEIHSEVSFITPRAVRYALERLRDQGKAKRGHRGRSGYRWTAVVEPL